MVGYGIPPMRSGNAHEKPYRRMQKNKMAQYRRTEVAQKDTVGGEKQQKSKIICRRIQIIAKKVVTLRMFRQIS